MNPPLKRILPAALVVFSCAGIGLKRPGPPVEPVVIPPSTPIVPVETQTHSILNMVQSLLHSAFTSIDHSSHQAALDSLSVATDHLVASYQDEPSVALLSRETADALTRAAIDIYFDALPGSAPIKPDAPIARLLQSLPDDLKSSLLTNTRYRQLHMKVLAGTSPIRIDVNARVLEKIAFFQRNGQRIFRTWMGRKGTYGPLIRRTLRKEGLPEDLIYLSMIESGFNTKAYSRARAVGMWQFVSHTGRMYGLRRDTWVDERRDPEKATRAAARHLRHLYNLFGDWQLVITAYNCGQGRLQRSMQADGTQDFWKLDSLPKETRNHLPKFMAVLLMARDPAFFDVYDLESDDPLSFDVVLVSDPIDLLLAAQCAGTTRETMQTLNPELRLGYSPPQKGRKTYALRVPFNTSDRFLDRYARIPSDKKVQMIDYKVRSGDTISKIAFSFGVRSSTVMDANGVRNPRRLRAGQRLKIPIHPSKSKHAQALTSRSRSTTAGKGEKVVYRVTRGDTLWDIAKSQGVTPEQIRAWNKIRTTGHIHPGDRLTLWIPDTPLPKGSEPLVETNVYHRVRRGDTLWDIARAYSTSIRELKRLNNIRNASQIKAGDRLQVREASAAVE